MEQRNHLLEIAAFLDRLDRCPTDDARDDFRLVAMREALQQLHMQGGGSGSRVTAIQMVLSDRDTTLLDKLDTKSAYGAPRMR